VSSRTHVKELIIEIYTLKVVHSTSLKLKCYIFQFKNAFFGFLNMLTTHIFFERIVRTAFTFGKRKGSHVLFFKGLGNECPGTLFKHSKFNKYSFKKSTITIFNAFITQLFIKNLPFKMLKECPGTLVNISLF